MLCLKLLLCTFKIMICLVQLVRHDSALEFEPETSSGQEEGDGENLLQDDVEDWRPAQWIVKISKYGLYASCALTIVLGFVRFSTRIIFIVRSEAQIVLPLSSYT